MPNHRAQAFDPALSLAKPGTVQLEISIEKLEGLLLAQWLHIEDVHPINQSSHEKLHQAVKRCFMNSFSNFPKRY